MIEIASQKLILLQYRAVHPTVFDFVFELYQVGSRTARSTRQGYHRLSDELMEFYPHSKNVFCETTKHTVILQCMLKVQRNWNDMVPGVRETGDKVH
jgi:hypothetical protein